MSHLSLHVPQAYAAIHQRIDLQCKPPHYDRAEVGAVDDIYRFSSGSARLINKVCTHCLMYGAQNKHRIIDDHMVKRVIAGELA